MTITRTQAAIYLSNQFDELASSVGYTATDDSALGYGPDINEALRTLGEDEGDLGTAAVADSNRKDYYALATFYAARRIYRKLRVRPDTSGQEGFNWGNVLEEARKDMEDAQKLCESLGYNVDGNAWGVLAYELDYIEPEPS